MIGGITPIRTIREIALVVREYITPYLDERGSITNEELADLIAEHTTHRITGDRNLNRVQVALCEL